MANRLRWAAGFAVLLALAVVVLGAYTRLKDAGLGCPDWPGCYGFLTVPDAAHEIETAAQRYPEAPFEADKAWPEMVHRYFAGALGLVIAGMAAVAWHGRRVGLPWKLPLALTGLVIVQAAFGMWTVTLQLWPQVVTAHLLGGFATLALLWLLWLRLDPGPRRPLPGLRGHALLALGALVVQVALGGWTSSNYAALACPDFPTCQLVWWPAMDAARGFDLAQPVGPNYLGGLLDGEARIAIHMVHRLGAVAVLLVVAGLLVRLWRRARVLALALGALLFVQLALGIANVVLTLPLAVATAHNAFAALLMLALVAVNYRAFSTPSNLPEPGA